MFNNTSHLNNSSSKKDEFCYWYVLAAIDVTAGVIGTIANILILLIVRRNTSMHTTVNLLMASLAVSDILTILWPIAFPTMEEFIDWKALGVTAITLYCTFVETLLEVVLASSIITLALLSIQHYQSLVCPMTIALRIKDKNTKYVIIKFFVWMLSFLLTVPTMVLSPTTDRSLILNDHNVCHSQIVSVGHKIFVTVLSLLVLVIVFCNSRILYGIYISKTILGENAYPNGVDQMKQKLVRTSVLITVTSIVCYLPIVVGFIIAVFSQSHYLFDEPLLIVACVLFNIKGTLNPFLYAFRSSNYRTALRKLLCKCGCKGKHTSLEMELK